MTNGLSPEERARGNEHQRRQYAEEAARYDRSSDRCERWLFGAGHRRWACSRATGRTLELAIGTGLNLPEYPDDAAVTGIDLTPEMLEQARRRAVDLRRRVELCEGDAQALPFPDGAFDTVLATYAMCSVPDLPQAIAEAKRVLRSGGRLILVDHVRSSVPPLFWLQRLMELAPSRTQDELTRRPIEQVRAAGFTIEGSDRVRAGVVERLVARRP
jgi:ubiquinone/menaquinone biosynthesis C-methylase UbiE